MENKKPGFQDTAGTQHSLSQGQMITENFQESKRTKFKNLQMNVVTSFAALTDTSNKKDLELQALSAVKTTALALG